MTADDFACPQQDETPFEYDPLEAREPRKKLVGMSPEWKLQAACVTHYNKRCRLDKHLRETTRLFACMNEGRRTPQRAAIAKMMGMVPGAPWDLTLMVKAGGRGHMPEFVTHWIECKREDGKLSGAQRDIAQWLATTPVRTHVVKTLDQFIEILEGR